MVPVPELWYRQKRDGAMPRLFSFVVVYFLDELASFGSWGQLPPDGFLPPTEPSNCCPDSIASSAVEWTPSVASRYRMSSSLFGSATTILL